MKYGSSDEREKSFYVGIHRYSFHAGVPAEIIGVVMITPEGLKPRPCFQIRFNNGDQDFVPIEEAHHYKPISEAEVVGGKILEVIH